MYVFELDTEDPIPIKKKGVFRAMLHAIHLIPARPIQFHHIGIRLHAALKAVRLSTQQKNKTPGITLTRCPENPETLNVLHKGVNDFIRWTGQIPSVVYVSRRHYETMKHWGFTCYYATLGPQMGCHKVLILAGNMDDDVAICVGKGVK